MPTKSAASAQQLSRFASDVEEIGYDSLWVADRLITPLHPKTPYAGGLGPQPYPPQFTRANDPILIWTVAATATSRVRLNSSTLNATLYHPVQLARALTTLEVLSDGRLDVGFGHGWMRDEHDVAGDWSTRGRRLDDLLDFLTAWWTTNPVNHDSPFFDFPPSQVDLKPVQPGGPPIYLGGATEAALRRVGRRAIGWLAIDGLPEQLAATLWDAARTAADEAGRDPDELRRALRINMTPGQDAQQVADRLAQAAEEGMDEALVDTVFAIPDADGTLAFADELMRLRRW